MSAAVKTIKLVCGHGIAGGEPTFVDRFRRIRTLGGKVWFTTVKPHTRAEQLRGSELQTYPLQGPPDESVPLRSRYSVECPKCRRALRLRDENLQALLTLAAAEGRDTLRLEHLTTS